MHSENSAFGDIFIFTKDISIDIKSTIFVSFNLTSS